ncbi:hypothetical protein Pelo_341 [Pelomyxa schiedti]|nr:hypothetical protein Pelo_341 [Pelomyxa schiedti]
MPLDASTSKEWFPTSTMKVRVPSFLLIENTWRNLGRTDTSIRQRVTHRTHSVPLEWVPSTSTISTSGADALSPTTAISSWLGCDGIHVKSPVLNQPPATENLCGSTAVVTPPGLLACATSSSSCTFSRFVSSTVSWCPPRSKLPPLTSHFPFTASQPHSKSTGSVSTSPIVSKPPVLPTQLHKYKPSGPPTSSQSFTKNSLSLIQQRFFGSPGHLLSMSPTTLPSSGDTLTHRQACMSVLMMVPFVLLRLPGGAGGPQSPSGSS